MLRTYHIPCRDESSVTLTNPYTKTAAILHKLFRVLPFLGRNILLFCLILDPKYLYISVKSVSPHTIISGLTLHNQSVPLAL